MEASSRCFGMDKEMSTFVALKSAGLGNRIKLYVSYMQRYENILIEKEPDLNLFENFKLCNKDEDIKIHPWTSSGWRLLVNEDEEKYCDKYKTIHYDEDLYWNDEHDLKGNYSALCEEAYKEIGGTPLEVSK